MPFVARAGSTGVDHSANPVGVPIAGGTLLINIPVNNRRNFLEVQNQSTAVLQLVRDDGSGNNATTIMLTGAASSPGQGAGWASDTFKGRIQVFGPIGSTVAAYED